MALHQDVVGFPLSLKHLQLQQIKKKSGAKTLHIAAETLHIANS